MFNELLLLLDVVFIEFYLFWFVCLLRVFNILFCFLLKFCVFLLYCINVKMLFLFFGLNELFLLNEYWIVLILFCFIKYVFVWFVVFFMLFWDCFVFGVYVSVSVFFWLDDKKFMLIEGIKNKFFINSRMVNLKEISLWFSV